MKVSSTYLNHVSVFKFACSKAVGKGEPVAVPAVCWYFPCKVKCIELKHFAAYLVKCGD